MQWAGRVINVTEPTAIPGSFEGLEVVAFESRLAAEMATLITKFGGVPRVAPAMRETPLEENAPAFVFGEALLAHRLDALICMTGVGTRRLIEVLEKRFPREAILEALRGIDDVAIVRLTERDVMRHPLVARIVGAYEARDRAVRGDDQPG